jgi:hypothetical protein
VGSSKESRAGTGWYFAFEDMSDRARMRGSEGGLMRVDG